MGEKKLAQFYFYLFQNQSILGKGFFSNGFHPSTGFLFRITCQTAENTYALVVKIFLILWESAKIWVLKWAKSMPNKKDWPK